MVGKRFPGTWLKSRLQTGNNILSHHGHEKLDKERLGFRPVIFFSWIRQKLFDLVICWHVSVVIFVATKQISKHYERCCQIEQLSRKFTAGYVTIYLANMLSVLFNLCICFFFFAIIQTPPQASAIHFSYLNA